MNYKLCVLPTSSLPVGIPVFTPNLGYYTLKPLCPSPNGIIVTSNPKSGFVSVSAGPSRRSEMRWGRYNGRGGIEWLILFSFAQNNLGARYVFH